MDAPPELGPGTGPSPARPGIDRTELGSILSHLSHELCRPLTSLRAGFDLLLGDAAGPIRDEPQRTHLHAMVGLCDKLLGLTRAYLDFAGLVRGACPPSLGRYTLRALISEVDR